MKGRGLVPLKRTWKENFKKSQSSKSQKLQNHQKNKSRTLDFKWKSQKIQGEHQPSVLSSNAYSSKSTLCHLKYISLDQYTWYYVLQYFFYRRTAQSTVPLASACRNCRENVGTQVLISSRFLNWLFLPQKI